MTSAVGCGRKDAGGGDIPLGSGAIYRARPTRRVAASEPPEVKGSRVRGMRRVSHNVPQESREPPWPPLQRQQPERLPRQPQQHRMFRVRRGRAIGIYRPSFARKMQPSRTPERVCLSPAPPLLSEFICFFFCLVYVFAGFEFDGEV